MSEAIKGKFTKLVWVRDPSVPTGKSAKGKIYCRCGGETEEYFFNYSTGEHKCNKCGSLFTYDGWVIEAKHEELSHSNYRNSAESFAGSGW